ncbi:MAG: hypothetical protein NC321_15525 [Clostridium sp.]|nr:hypothetical protein [Clostridium sp.]
MNEKIYVFNGKDITMNVCIQIRAVADVLQKRLNVGFAEIIEQFYNSATYEILQDVQNGFWAESPEYIADKFIEEID